MSGKLDEEFQYLNTRIHTREHSTLTIATVAASASLICFTLYVQQKTELLSLPFQSTINIQQQLVNFLLLIQNRCEMIYLIGILGFSLALLGVLYREVTVFTIDIKDYNALRNRINLGKLPGKDWWVRAIIFRVFMYLPLSLWSPIILRIFLDKMYCLYYTDLSLIIVIVIMIIIIVSSISVTCLEDKKRDP